MKILCPICQKILKNNDKDWFCSNNHHFDQAKEGYLHLLPGQKKEHGDEKEMVQARHAFLAKNYYLFLKEYLILLSANYPHQNVTDFGCGEGYYTRSLVADTRIGIDASKIAIKYASKKDPDSQYIVASFFQPLLPENSQDIVLSCFAPIAKQEINRILKPNGIFIAVTPAPKHLWQLKEILYDQPYLNQNKELDLPFQLCKEEVVESLLKLNNEDLQALFKMTPYYHHTPINGRKRLAQTEKLELLASFKIRIYQKN